MNNNLEKSPLWAVLVETVHSLPLYHSHKMYIKENILPEKPEISPEDLSESLDMPLGEAFVILEELKSENSEQKNN